MSENAASVKPWKWSSCNVKSLKGKLPHFKKIFHDNEIVALQETHVENGRRIAEGYALVLMVVSSCVLAPQPEERH